MLFRTLLLLIPVALASVVDTSVDPVPFEDTTPVSVLSERLFTGEVLGARELTERGSTPQSCWNAGWGYCKANGGFCAPLDARCCAKGYAPKGWQCCPNNTITPNSYTCCAKGNGCPTASSFCTPRNTCCSRNLVCCDNGRFQCPKGSYCLNATTRCQWPRKRDANPDEMGGQTPGQLLGSDGDADAEGDRYAPQFED